MTQRSQSERRVRRSAMLLGLLALAFYAAYYMIQVTRPLG